MNKEVHKAITEIIEQLEPKVREFIQPEQPTEDEIKANIQKAIEESIDPQQHVHIDVGGSPEDIEKGIFVVTLTALDELGVKLIKDMQK